MYDELCTSLLRERTTQVEEARKKGTKLIGYLPGNYVPEELIYAAGAIPFCLIQGGKPQPAELALSVVPRVICPFARAQIGERQLKDDPYYNTMDMLIAPITCQHLKKLAEVWEYMDHLPMFKLGIPHQTDQTIEFEYFTDRIKALKERLEAFTGNIITKANLSEAIDLYNKIRQLFRKISLLRQSDSSILDCKDFVKLNHASFYVDPTVMIHTLESIYSELQNKTQNSEKNSPRLMIIGPCLAKGDYGILHMVESAGGKIVIEEICEGIRNYWNAIHKSDDPFKSLAKGYMTNRIPCAFMRNSTGKRLDFTKRLINDFKIEGVIWYELLCCETYDSEAYYFSQKLSKQNIPVLILESDYGTADNGQFKTRIEAFIEIVRQGVD